MQEAIILEASSTEECVEGVHGLLPGDRLRVGAVYVGSAFGGQTARVVHFRQHPVPDDNTPSEHPTQHEGLQQKQRRTR